jgi:hypothetical protein
MTCPVGEYGLNLIIGRVEGSVRLDRLLTCHSEGALFATEESQTVASETYRGVYLYRVRDSSLTCTAPCHSGKQCGAGVVQNDMPKKVLQNIEILKSSF